MKDVAAQKDWPEVWRDSVDKNHYSLYSIIFDVVNRNKFQWGVMKWSNTEWAMNTYNNWEWVAVKQSD